MSKVTLKTIAHACLIIYEDGEPVLATDPWLIGSAYWGSWWLERYPDKSEIDDVRQARYVYVTHSHPDHFHPQSISHLQVRKHFLHPQFVGYGVPAYLQEEGHENTVLEPCTWKQVSENVRVCSVPVLIDDSILIIDTPKATVIDVNDAAAPGRILKYVKRALIRPGNRVVVLKSYSPASSGAATFRDGVRVPLKSKRDFAQKAQSISEALDADLFVPFASQVFFGRSDSEWANEQRVTQKDLAAYWTSKRVRLGNPFIDLDLDTFKWTSSEDEVRLDLRRDDKQSVAERLRTEAGFVLPADFPRRLREYLRGIPCLFLLYPTGLQWRLTTSKRTFFYNPWTRRISEGARHSCAFQISIPDQVVYEGVCNDVLTDIGITLFVRTDTNIGLRRTYLFFLLMAMRDYKHFKGVGAFASFVKHYRGIYFPKRAKGRRSSGDVPGR